MSTDEGEAQDEDVSVRIAPPDIARLDEIAARRGVARGDLIAEAVDEFLANEGLSGRFIAPPPRMRLPWRRQRAHRRDRQRMLRRGG